ncbi:MAG: hypothetical protein MUF54_14955, partial [Polyangiaceae bacterium]|nr:hypothetical protein [Polyangiaceae bacterium]
MPDGSSSTGRAINHRGSVHDEHGVTMVWVDGQVWMAFDTQDLAARRLCARAAVDAQGRDPAAAGVGVRRPASEPRACSARAAPIDSVGSTRWWSSAD